MQNENTPKIPDDEIDLRSVGRRIYYILSYPFYLLLSNIFITLGFIALAIALAVCLKFCLAKTYSSSFIIRPLDRNEKIHLKILDDFQTLLKNKDYATLSRELKIDSLLAETMLDLKISNASLKTPIDSLNSTEVTLTLSDYNQFIPIQNALHAYLENSPYFLKIKELQKKQIEAELYLAERDITSLDSLKVMQLRNYEKQMSANQNYILLADRINPTATYSMAIERINKKSNLLARVAFLDNFQMVKSCLVIKKPSFPPRMLIMLAYLIPFFLIICVIFLHTRNQKLPANRKEISQSPIP